MKIAVCGKGGSGKSTITTLLAKEYGAQGKKVLVIDCDESNYGLHQQLGMELPNTLTQYMGGKGKILNDMANGPQNVPMMFDRRWTLDDIPKDCCSEKDGIKLMTPGKIEEANEACACAFSVVMLQFMAILDVKDDEMVIVDMEAGTEHFGRGTDNPVDVVLMVVDPSYESLRLAEKVSKMSKSIGKKLYFILNKTNEENEAVMRDAVKDFGPVLASFPMDAQLQKAGLMGQELSSGHPQASAMASAISSAL